MYTFNALLLAFLIITYVQESASAECEFGESKKEACNNCFCTAGRVWACTQRSCGMHKRAECEFGESKKEGCNNCFCTAGRVWACTNRTCGINKRETCKHLSVKEVDICNHCLCIRGVWQCTKRNCWTKNCKNGETVYMSCNTCKCYDGRPTHCTLDPCTWLKQGFL